MKITKKVQRIINNDGYHKKDITFSMRATPGQQRRRIARLINHRLKTEA